MTHKEGKGRERSPPFEVLKLLIISKLSEENKMENKTNTTYTYHFATGDKTVEISEYWAEILADLDREEYNNDHKQFRDARRCGSEIGEMEDKMIKDPFELEDTVVEELRLEYLRGKLTNKQNDVLTALIDCDGNLQDVCREMGMDRSTLQSHRDMIRDKLHSDFYRKKVIDDVKTGSNIRRLRLSAELSGSLMADLIGVNYRKYFRIEKGESGLTEEMAAKIATYFGIPVNEIFEYKI